MDKGQRMGKGSHTETLALQGSWAMTWPALFIGTLFVGPDEAPQPQVFSPAHCPMCFVFPPAAPYFTSQRLPDNPGL